MKMVQSKAATVDAWMTEIAPDRLDAISRMRAACLAHLPGWEERMQWGMPGYAPAGVDAQVSFNNQKGYVALYVGSGAIAHVGDALKGIDCGKGCVRYKKIGAIDFATVAAMLDHAYAHKQPGC